VVKVVLLLALALIVSSVQCAAACTPVSCAPQPPCHHHKQAPKADCHELIPATTVQAFVVDVLFLAEPVDASPVSGSTIQITQDPYQPVLTGPPIIALRI
jgi:hypothetical protein